MPLPLPPRSPAEIAAASAAIAEACADCGHARAGHAPDGCRVCQLQGRPTGVLPGQGRLCAGFRPVDPWAEPRASEVIEAEVLAPVHDAIRVALEGAGSAPRFVAPPYADAAVAAVVTALEQHTSDVADYLRLDTDGLTDALDLLEDVVTDYAPADCHRGCRCSAARARAFLAARGIQADRP